MTIKGVEVVRSHAMVRLPYCDNDLLDFCLTLPLGLRFERRLMKNAFIRNFPEMAQIPFADTGLPMMICLRDVRERAKKVIQWRLRSMGVKWKWTQERRPYKNYNLWFRTILRPWVESTLLNKHALERGYFNPDYLRQIVANHMNGADYTVHLGALLSIELWHKKFLD
jgi:asparagine synthase (glutamine-hydrolysing)